MKLQELEDQQTNGTYVNRSWVESQLNEIDLTFVSDSFWSSGAALGGNLKGNKTRFLG